MTLPKLVIRGVTLGCDPEFFFKKDGEVIGSEKIIGDSIQHFSSKIVMDGVQAELNPSPSTCRQSLRSSLFDGFVGIANAIAKHSGVELESKQTVTMTKKEMDTLSEKSKVFGCAPSKNTKPIKVKMRDAKVYMHRSAGGHIHMGNADYLDLKGLMSKIGEKRFVDMLDIIVGNTCVLLDRDEGNIERRKVYGRAGEYRTPDHGLEYRTPSNFWLRSPVLFSLVTGLCRTAINIVANSVDEGIDYEGAILEKVDMDKIHKAINKNDFNLAMKNFKKIVPVLEQFSGQVYNGYAHQLHKEGIYAILKLADQGLDRYFGSDMLNNWLYDSHMSSGWEFFAAHMERFDRSALARLRAKVKKALE